MSDFVLRAGASLDVPTDADGQVSVTLASGAVRYAPGRPAGFTDPALVIGVPLVVSPGLVLTAYADSLVRVANDPTPVGGSSGLALSSKGHTGGQLYGDSISFGTGANDPQWSFPARLAQALRVPVDNDSVGGAVSNGGDGSGSAKISQLVANKRPLSPPRVAGGHYPNRPYGKSFYGLHFGMSEKGGILGNGPHPDGAIRNGFWAMISRLRSHITIEDSDSMVTAAGGAGGTAVVRSDQNSGLSTRRLTAGQSISIGGGIFDAFFPGGRGYLRFLLEPDQVQNVTVNLNGVPTVIDLSSAGQMNPNRFVSFRGWPTGGTFTLTYAGQTTGALAYNATTAVVQSALEGLSTIGVGNVIVTGVPGLGLWVNILPAVVALRGTSVLTGVGTLTGGLSAALVVYQATIKVVPITLVPGVNNISLTAGVTSGAGVQFDALDIECTGSAVPVVALYGPHKVTNNGNTSFFKGQLTDPVVDALIALEQSIAAEFDQKVTFVDFDAVIQKSPALIADDGIHLREEAYELLAQAAAAAMPALTPAETIALGTSGSREWQDISLDPAWSIKRVEGFNGFNYPPQWRRHADGTIELRGIATHPTTTPVGQVFGTLPQFARPLAAIRRLVDTDNGPGRIYIFPGPAGNPNQTRGADGQIYASTGGTAGGYLDLDGVRFQAGE